MQHSSQRIEDITQKRDKNVVAAAMDVLNAMSLESNVIIASIYGVYRLPVLETNNSKLRARLVKLATYRVKQHIFNDKKKIRNISLPLQVYKSHLKISLFPLMTRLNFTSMEISPSIDKVSCTNEELPIKSNTSPIVGHLMGVL